MVSINKSFIYGICFASVTWVISLYLYLQLIKNDEAVNKATILPFNSNNLDKFKYNQYSKYESPSKILAERRNNYVNSDKLRNYLKPFILKTPKTNTSKNEQDLNELGMIRTVEDKYAKVEGYKTHAYNILISNKLSLHRSIPDTRNALCKNITYDVKNFPKTSVIICFYNEHITTLLRTIHSILDRTPARLLEEIMLVNDASDLIDLHETISDYLKENDLKKVKLFRMEKREGLIRARMFGAKKAQGEVILFLDSHVEVNTGWIEPLIDRIHSNKTNVVMPVIDIINADSFAYSSSPLVRGGFNWGLHFKWENLPKGSLSKKEDFVKPIKSPTMAGGLFAINRKYFMDMGEYDAGMNIWGGENLEISFRIWMCGGQLELIPCSRVGHIFRQRRPYGSPDGQDTMLYNSLRVAHVWMDDYKEHFLNHRRDAKSMDFGDIQSRIQLRKELKCQDFNWYLKNVYPELILPTDNEERLKKKWAAVEHDKYQPWHSRKRNYTGQFQIRLTNSSFCIQSNKDTKTKGSKLVLRSCLRTKAQMWYETDRHELVLAQLLCLQAQESFPILYKCHEAGGDQEWKHVGQNKVAIYNIGAGTCLGVEQKLMNEAIAMKICTSSELNMWDLIK